MITKRTILLLTLLGFLAPFLANAACSGGCTITLTPNSTTTGNEAGILISSTGDYAAATVAVCIFNPNGTPYLGSLNCGNTQGTLTTAWSSFTLPTGLPAGTGYYFGITNDNVAGMKGNCQNQNVSCLTNYGSSGVYGRFAITGGATTSTTGGIGEFIQTYGWPLTYLLGGILFIGFCLGILELIKAGREEWHKRVV
jgi:hypothetical protein